MKNILLYFAAALTLMGCQKDIVDYDLASHKAELFLTGAANSDLKLRFVASTVDLVPERFTATTSAAMRVRSDHHDSEFSDIVAAFDELIVPLTQVGHLNAQQRYDLEQLINNTRLFMDRTPASPEKAAVAARYLRYMMEYSEPIDLHLLTKYYVASAGTLPKNEAKRYRAYILDRAVTTLREPMPEGMPPTRHDLLVWQSHHAIKTLAPAKK